MAANIQPEHQLIAGALVASFDKWASNHKQYRSLYKKMDRGVLQIIETGLSEIPALNPISWDTWWLTEHNRFRGNGVRQEDKRNLTQLMHSFLGDFARGKVHSNDKSSANKKRRRKTSAPNKRANEVRRD